MDKKNIIYERLNRFNSAHRAMHRAAVEYEASRQVMNEKKHYLKTTMDEFRMAAESLRNIIPPSKLAKKRKTKTAKLVTDMNALPVDKDLNLLQQKLDDNIFEDTSNPLCSVCVDKRKDTAVYDCGHLCLCSICATVLKNLPAQHSKCPVCHKRITQLLRIYF